MIEGITILNTIANETFVLGWTPVGTVFLILTIIFTILVASVTLYKRDIALLGFGALGVIGLAILTIRVNQVPGEPYNTYEVTIDDSVKMNEFLERYEIIEQRGEIYEIKEKEADSN